VADNNRGPLHSLGSVWIAIPASSQKLTVLTARIAAHVQEWARKFVAALMALVSCPLMASRADEYRQLGQNR
jgi:hypothetical protein